MVKSYTIKALVLPLSFLFFTNCLKAQEEEYFLHSIKAGETVERIAKQNHTTVAVIMQLNNITPKSLLRVGKSIKLPMAKSEVKNTPKAATAINATVNQPAAEVVATTEQNAESLYVIKEGETLSSIAKANNTTVGDIMRLNGMNGKSVLKAGVGIKLPEVSNKNAATLTPQTKLPSSIVPTQEKKIPTSPVAVSEVKPESNNLLHVIKEGETLSAIAKANRTNVGDIMRLNGMNGKSVLKVGESIKIPDGENNKTAIATTTTIDEKLSIPLKPINSVKPKAMVAPVLSVVKTALPVKYTVTKGDNLYRISKTFKTTEAQLMQWNGMSDDKVQPGQIITVGQEITTQKVLVPQKDTNQVVKPIPSIQQKKSLPHFVARDTTQHNEPVEVVDTTGVFKPNIDSSNTVFAKDTFKTAKLDSVVAVKANKPFITKDSLIAKVAEGKENTINLDPKPIPKYAKYADEEGFYAGYFNRKNINKNTVSGDAAAFKSNSGWNDKKYYVLINDVNQGSIVRITANNKSICAKVMGPLPNIKEDAGLLLRLNSASASALGISDARFSVAVDY